MSDRPHPLDFQQLNVQIGSIHRRVVEALKADDGSGLIFDEHNFVFGFFRDVFLVGVVQPNGQSFADCVVVDF